MWLSTTLNSLALSKQESEHDCEHLLDLVNRQLFGKLGNIHFPNLQVVQDIGQRLQSGKLSITNVLLTLRMISSKANNEVELVLTSTLKLTTSNNRPVLCPIESITSRRAISLKVAAAYSNYIQAISKQTQYQLTDCLKFGALRKPQAQQMSHQTRGAGTALFVAICPSIQLTPVSPDTEETV